jgi:hypothetical protein
MVSYYTVAIPKLASHTSGRCSVHSRSKLDLTRVIPGDQGYSAQLWREWIDENVK